MGSYFDAIKHNIKVRQEGRQYFYNVKCCKCDYYFERLGFNEKNMHQYICKRCKAPIVVNNETLHDKKEKKFKDAVKRIEKVTKINSSYQKAIDLIYKNLHRKSWFQSTEEIMVAIELLRHNIKTIHQQKIDRYKIDFVLPDLKIILEVDGEIYHNDITKQGIRDGTIILRLGLDWKVLRVPTKKINKNITKLKKLIDETLK